MVQDSGRFKQRSIISLSISTLLVVLALLFLVDPARAEFRASQLEIEGGRDRTTVSLNLDREPDLRWFQLGSPYRLVIELPQTAFAIEKKALRPVGLVAGIRYGEAGEGRSRLILSSTRPFLVDSVEVEPAGKTFRLAIALRKSNTDEFRAALAGQVATTGAIGDSPQEATPAGAGRPFTIVVDAGHGGFDGGARGKNGAVEKEITLAFAKDLESKLKETPGYDVYMTRSDDRFLRLDERVEFARSRSADLLISIHADSIRVKGLRGATVYTGSDRASDAEAEALAERENLADQVAGMPASEESAEVSDILFDFVRRETQGFSTTVAGRLVHHLSTSIGVINNPHRHARFRVLRAPDVPSVLVELGYLSNTEDEKSLMDPAWRAKAAESIAAAVAEFAALRRPQALSNGEH